VQALAIVAGTRLGLVLNPRDHVRPLNVQPLAANELLNNAGSHSVVQKIATDPDHLHHARHRVNTLWADFTDTLADVSFWFGRNWLVHFLAYLRFLLGQGSAWQQFAWTDGKLENWIGISRIPGRASPAVARPSDQWPGVHLHKLNAEAWIAGAADWILSW
jgi:hypothetical protein